MATVVHIPIADLPGSAELSERIRAAEEIILEETGASYHFTRQSKGPGRTADEMLALLRNRPVVGVDDEWASDLEAVVALRHAEPSRDPWA